MAERAKPRQLPSEGDGIDAVDPENDNQIVLSLARGLQVLEAFERNDPSLGNHELSERTGLTRSNVSRITYTLARSGYLHFDSRRREYQLGVKAIRLGSVALTTISVRSIAVPHMAQLAAGSQFNVGLGTRDGYQMVYTDACEGDALVGLRLFPGSRIPIPTSAMGRAYLAVLPAADREALLGELRGRYADEWARVRYGVDQAVNDMLKYGYCVSVGDWQKDIHGIAVPIRSASPEQLTYVLNLGGPAYMLSEKEMREILGPKLQGIARSIEASFGVSGAVEPEPSASFSHKSA